MLPLQAEGPFQARLSEGTQAVFSVSPAERISTSNRFSLLGHNCLPDSGHDPGPIAAAPIAVTSSFQLTSVASQDRLRATTKASNGGRRPLCPPLESHEAVAAVEPLAKARSPTAPPSSALIKLRGF